MHCIEGCTVPGSSFLKLFLCSSFLSSFVCCKYFGVLFIKHERGMWRRGVSGIGFFLDAQKTLAVVCVTPTAEFLEEERDRTLLALAALTPLTQASPEKGIIHPLAISFL